MASKEQESYAEQGGAFIQARGLTLKTPLGTPYENINLNIPRGSYVAVVGEHGSGKTPLLLTLAGRMKFNSGSLSVGGHVLPKERKKVARTVGMSIFSGLNDVEWELKCKTIMAAELEIWGKPHSKADAFDYLNKWGLGHIMEMKVTKLSQIDYDRFGIALGMVNDPAVLVVDDIEDKMDIADRDVISEELLQMAHTQNKIVIVAITEPDAARMADITIKLERSESDGL